MSTTAERPPVLERMRLLAERLLDAIAIAETDERDHVTECVEMLGRTNAERLAARR